ncbi:hypothetical protein [Pantoea ananatis]|uniref:hypothetical protein n=1 Tax=Pantoea ananas TaxID=553 RepID=UPI0007DAC31B|nr:hypothetical protein [Pantoea ananatis]
MTTNSPNPVDGDVQALIEQCKENIDTLTVALKHCDQEEADEIYRNLELQKVALAALTAEPVKTKLKYSSVLPKFIGDTTEIESVHCWVHGNTPEFATNEEAYAEAQKMTGDLYTNPPAQLLRPVELPDCVDDLHGVGPVMSADAVVEILRQQGYEVKND